MVEDLIKRLREKSQGRVKWFAMNKAETAYFIDFNSGWDARRWLDDQNKRMSEWVEREGVHLVEQRVFTELEELAKQAAAALEQKAALESERDALLAAAGKEAVKGEPVFYADDEQMAEWREGRRGGLDLRVVSIALGSCTTPLYTSPTAALDNGDVRDAERMRALCDELDRNRRGVRYDGMAIWDAMCDAIGNDLDGKGFRKEMDKAIAALSQKAGEPQ